MRAMGALTQQSRFLTFGSPISWTIFFNTESPGIPSAPPAGCTATRSTRSCASTSFSVPVLTGSGRGTIATCAATVIVIAATIQSIALATSALATSLMVVLKFRRAAAKAQMTIGTHASSPSMSRLQLDPSLLSSLGTTMIVVANGISSIQVAPTPRSYGPSRIISTRLE